MGIGNKCDAGPILNKSERRWARCYIDDILRNKLPSRQTISFLPHSLSPLLQKCFDLNIASENIWMTRVCSESRNNITIFPLWAEGVPLLRQFTAIFRWFVYTNTIRVEWEADANLPLKLAILAKRRLCQQTIEITLKANKGHSPY